METVCRCGLRLLPFLLLRSREVDAQVVLSRVENRARSRGQMAERSSAGQPRRAVLSHTHRRAAPHVAELRA
jgi:hypothetical protein